MAPRASADRRGRRTAGAVLVACALAAPLPATASMLALDEQALAGIEAGDGIRIDLGDTGTIALAQMKWVTDNGAAAAGACTGGVANQHACTIVGNATLGGSGGPLLVSTTLDVGAPAATGGPIGIAVGADWNAALLALGSITLNTPTVDYSARSLGSLGIISQGFLRLGNQDQLFSGGATAARMQYSSTGDMIYRQGAAGSPELSFGNFLFTNRFSNGAAGGQLDAWGKVTIDDAGLLVSSAYADTDLLFDLMFKAAPAGYDTAGRSSIILFGWTGGLVNPQVRVAPGGYAYGTYVSGPYTYNDFSGTNGGGARSEGLNINASWDFDSDFSWVLGQAGGNRTQVRFSNWRKLGTSPSPMLSMPLTLDVLQNGTGPTGMCFGGGFASGSPVQASCTTAGGSWIAGGVPAGKAAIATLIRDGHLTAYNQLVEVFDPSSILPYSAYNWSLVYTFGKLDADLFFYPEGRGQGVAVTTTTTGLKADITLAAQSPGYWDKANNASAAIRATAGAGWATNTHFMLADTNVGGGGTQYGVGLVNADLLWRVRDMYFRVVSGDTGYPLLPGGLWMQTDNVAQYRFRGMFGGGNLQNLASPTAIGLLDLNLQANRFIFVLNPVAPSGGDAPVGFAGLLDLDGSAYLSIAEVSSPSSSFRIYGATGRIGWLNGRVNLVSGQNNPPTNLPKLSINNDLLFGSSANFGDGGGAPFIGNVGFGSEYFGRMAMPSGTWHSDVTIKIPGT